MKRLTLVLIVLLLLVTTTAVIGHASALSLVVWKQHCSIYQDLSFVYDDDGVTVVCSVGDGVGDRKVSAEASE